MAKARIACALLAGDRDVDPRLGDLTLRPHQLTAVSRLLEIIASYRGALLADAVGLGKTYVALACAREYENTIVICPAALRGMWERAMKSARAVLRTVSVESLSRGTMPELQPGFLVIDEAHHFRTPGTRRYEAVAQLARRARVLLLSATPLHNSRRDLTSVLALFAGAGVADWTDRALARLIVRRDDATADETLPSISGPHALSPAEDDGCLDAILALPPAVPAADEGVAHALTMISMVHLWSSSRAALVASVRKRLARATALYDAVAAGHLPNASELAAWCYADGALQLAFPLFTPNDHIVDQEALHNQLSNFIERATALLRQCEATADPDEARVALLRTLREQHTAARVVAFSQYAHTIAGLGRLLRGDQGIAIVTGTGARIASGALPRDEVLRQFAGDAPLVRPVERIDLLLTTDLLSEGVDLRGGSVIVHLDLPWNPSRLEQRVGRARRIGSRFDTIHVYTFVPPTAAERLIEIRRRLADKVKAAREIVGGAFDPFGQPALTASPVTAGEALRARMRDWSADGWDTSEESPAVGAAASRTSGWIAAVVVSGVARLIGVFGAGITDDAEALARALDDVDVGRPVGESECRRALDSIRDWLAARDATAGMEQYSVARRAVLDRLTQTVARAPRHRRSSVVSLAQRTRHALEGAVGIGTERVLATLARSPIDDEAWLHSLDAFGALHGDESTRIRSDHRVVALILVGPVSEADATPG
jgi:superfamily II DNA or RNA helicase